MTTKVVTSYSNSDRNHIDLAIKAESGKLCIAAGKVIVAGKAYDTPAWEYSYDAPKANMELTVWFAERSGKCDIFLDEVEVGKDVPIALRAHGIEPLALLLHGSLDKDSLEADITVYKTIVIGDANGD